jgi:ribosomal protein L11
MVSKRCHVTAACTQQCPYHMPSQPATPDFSCQVSRRVVQVRPGTNTADGDVLHITISVDYLKNRRIENVILSVPYASHILDVYTNRREDKRTLLQSGYMRVNRLYDAAEMQSIDATQTQAQSAVGAASSVSHSMG